MIFREAVLPGAYVVELEPLADARGFFARTFCAREFAEHGLPMTIAQCNLSVTRRRGTIRGLHYLAPPAAETKLVRCTRGAIFDVMVDVRPDSPTYLRHSGVELTGENRRAVYVPPMVAHGFQTLVDETEVEYQMGDFYVAGHERGLRFDDPALGLAWPLPVGELSEKDAGWPLLGAAAGAR